MGPGVIGHERNPAETARCKRTEAGGSSVNPGIVGGSHTHSCSLAVVSDKLGTLSTVAECR